MKKRQLIPSCLIVAGIFALSAQAPAAATQPAFGKLDKFLPSKVAGWKAEEIDEIGDHSLAVNRYYKGSGETQVSAEIIRHRPNSLLGVPKVEGAQLGELPEGGGFASYVTVGDRKALLTFHKQDKYGKLFMMGGKCSVTLDGTSLTDAQLVALARAFDLKGLEAECK